MSHTLHKVLNEVIVKVEKKSFINKQLPENIENNIKQSLCSSLRQYFHEYCSKILIFSTEQLFSVIIDNLSYVWQADV